MDTRFRSAGLGRPTFDLPVYHVIRYRRVH